MLFSLNSKSISVAACHLRRFSFKSFTSFLECTYFTFWVILSRQNHSFNIAFGIINICYLFRNIIHSLRILSNNSICHMYAKWGRLVALHWLCMRQKNSETAMHSKRKMKWEIKSPEKWLLLQIVLLRIAAIDAAKCFPFSSRPHGLSAMLHISVVCPLSWHSNSPNYIQLASSVEEGTSFFIRLFKFISAWIFTLSSVRFPKKIGSTTWREQWGSKMLVRKGDTFLLYLSFHCHSTSNRCAM